MFVSSVMHTSPGQRFGLCEHELCGQGCEAIRSFPGLPHESCTDNESVWQCKVMHARLELRRATALYCKQGHCVSFCNGLAGQGCNGSAACDADLQRRPANRLERADE